MTAAAIFFQILDSEAFVFQKFDLQSLDLQSFAQVSSARLVNCTVEGIGIALLAWILLRVLGRQNSHTRPERFRDGKAVRNCHAGFVGTLHICRLGADCNRGPGQNSRRILALAAAPARLPTN
jgi:hypothetical protein